MWQNKFKKLNVAPCLIIVKTRIKENIKRARNNAAQKMKFPADLVTFTDEILNEKVHFYAV